jgi:saccharopine dehydrogenase-like NADP-dependent oxidoreductase
MKILVLGAGRMGHGAVFDLIHNSPDVETVTVADLDLNKAQSVAAAVGSSRVEAKQIDTANYADGVELMRGHDSAISCVNYWYNLSLSKAAWKPAQISATLAATTMSSMNSLLWTPRQKRQVSI